MKLHKKTVMAVASFAVLAIPTMAANAAGRFVNMHRVEAGALYDGFIVKFKEGTPVRDDAAAVPERVRSINADLRKSRHIQMRAGQTATDVEIGHVRRISTGSDFVRPNRKLSKAEAGALLKTLAERDDVEYVTPNLLLQTQMTPNDPMYAAYQWPLTDQNVGVRPALAWDLARGKGVTVAVLDSGLTSHPETNGNIIPGIDFISSPESAGDGDGRDANYLEPYLSCPDKPELLPWHGTHVTGIIAGLTNNGLGLASLAHESKVLPARVAGKCGASLVDIIDAITWTSGGAVPGIVTLAPHKTAKVLNLSLGGPSECITDLQNAVSAAVSRGSTLVVAAGNEQADVSTSTPANCQNVIAVSAHGTNGGLATAFSNFGWQVDVSAPGVDVWSSDNNGTTALGQPVIGLRSGTSMAAPHVSGIAAMMQSHRLAKNQPHLTPEQVESILKSTTRPMLVPCPEGCGTGMVDAKAALDASLSVGFPARIVIKQNQAQLMQYQGAPYAAMPGTVPVTSATVWRRMSGVAGVGTDNKLYVRNFTSTNWTLIPIYNTTPIISVATMRDGMLLAVGTNNSLYVRSSMTTPWSAVPNSGGVRSVAAMPDGSLLGVGLTGNLMTRATLTSAWVNLPADPQGITLDAVAVHTNGLIYGVGGGMEWRRASLSEPWQAASPLPTGVTNVSAMIY